MNIGDQVRIAQSAGYHAGDAGTVIDVDADIVTVQLKSGCMHAFASEEVDGTHRYGSHTLSFLDAMLEEITDSPGEFLPVAGSDFSALREHVKANLA